MKNRKQEGSWYLNSNERKTKIMKTSKKQSLLLSILLKSSDQKMSKNLIVYFLDNKYLLLMCLKNLLIYESPISQFWELTRDLHNFFKIKSLHEDLSNYANEKVMLSLKMRSSHQRCSMLKGFLRKFTKFTGEHLC